MRITWGPLIDTLCGCDKISGNDISRKEIIYVNSK